ncbi:5'-adenylylsulfate reductase-like 5 [Sesamum alatum]|uniref:5'-adenylylsulfate reductase-like 5 n=1 Tax=Sesamum alatum TaxID=300844 RepID=A0AAE1Z234_9LAMI|nr:5'-adenylylsulfate reductase-like 5 [Sesamum alatum]
MEFAPMTKCLCIFIFILAAASPTSSICQHNFKTFLYDLNSQCPSSIPTSSSPIQVDDELFERAMSSSQKNEYTAVLFYASWCPFSSIFLSKFSTLSSMYPQIRHLMLEQTSVQPSVFSRYGIHSVPALLIVDQTIQIRYHGRKDLQSLVNFYKRTTGLDPMVDRIEDASSKNLEMEPKVFQLWHGASLKEIFLREPYLALSVIFVLSRALLYFFPEIASQIMAMWAACIPHLNIEMFGESRQLIGRLLYLIDVKRIWSKLKLCKTRNFHKGARNARVWASSLASVSLGETSSSRIFPSRDL